MLRARMLNPTFAATKVACRPILAAIENDVLRLQRFLSVSGRTIIGHGVKCSTVAPTT
jgi:hypothetical protein